MSDRLKELLILLVAVASCSFSASISGSNLGKGEASRTTHGVMVGAVVLAYKAWSDTRKEKP